MRRLDEFLAPFEALPLLWRSDEFRDQSRLAQALLNIGIEIRAAGLTDKVINMANADHPYRTAFDAMVFVLQGGEEAAQEVATLLANITKETAIKRDWSAFEAAVLELYHASRKKQEHAVDPAIVSEASATAKKGCNNISPRISEQISFSSTELKVIRALRSSSARWFWRVEIKKLSKLSLNTIRKILKKLIGLELVTTQADNSHGVQLTTKGWEVTQVP